MIDSIKGAPGLVYQAFILILLLAAFEALVADTAAFTLRITLLQDICNCNGPAFK
jgi:hypothetical protein